MNSKKNNTTAPTTKQDAAPAKHCSAPKPGVPLEQYDFTAFFWLFLSENPFLAGVLNSVQYGADWSAPTAQIGVNQDGRIRMVYNPEFFRNLKPNQRAGVITHELYHLLLGHITHRNVGDRKHHALWNVATDAAINAMIGKDNLPANGIIPGYPLCDGADPELSALVESWKNPGGTGSLLESADWFFEQLLAFVKQKKQQKNGDEKGGEGDDESDEDDEITLNVGGGDGNGETMDSHGGWQDIPEEVKDIIREAANEAARSGHKRMVASGKGWGNIPQEMQEFIEQMLKNEVDWRSILRMFIGRAAAQDRASTYRKISHRAPYKMPGARRETVANIGFFIDQSGSVSDEDVQRGLGEAFACSKLAALDVVNFDTEVDLASMQRVERGKIKWVRTRCGGTDFGCVSRYVNANKGKWPAIVIFTDGYADTMPPIHGTKVLWVITEGGTMAAPRPGDLVVQIGQGEGKKKFSRRS